MTKYTDGKFSLGGKVNATEAVRIKLLLRQAFPTTVTNRRIATKARQFAPEHDDGHKDREMARAAQAYVHHYIARSWTIDNDLNLGTTLETYTSEPAPDEWPEEWDGSWWKPKGKIEDLTRAGALIAAEIDRLNRLAARQVCEGR